MSLPRWLEGGLAAAAMGAALGVTSPVAAQLPSGGDGLLYVGTYASDIHVISEADFSVVARIPTTAGIPGGLMATAGGTRLVSPTIDYEWVETFDVVSRRSVDAFTLSERNTKARISSMAVHPDGRHAVLMLRRYTKLRDRWDVSEMELLLYDMQTHQVVQPIPWPDDEPEQTRANFGFSADGERFLFFKQDVHIYETDTYTEIDRWDYGDMLDDQLGDFRFGFSATPREQDDWYAGLFRIHEEFQDRDVVGVARANPLERRVETILIGPAENGPQGSFALSPDRGRGYALRQDVGNYQLWGIDLETGAAHHVVFPGRPRMSLEVSSNGELLYIYAAGNTIDLHDAETLERVGTVELDADMTIGRLWVLPRESAARR